MINLELIAKFNEIAINNRIDPFFEADILNYFDNASQFSLGIKRAKKKSCTIWCSTCKNSSADI